MTDPCDEDVDLLQNTTFAMNMLSKYLASLTINTNHLWIAHRTSPTDPILLFPIFTVPQFIKRRSKIVSTTRNWNTPNFYQKANVRDFFHHWRIFRGLPNALPKGVCDSSTGACCFTKKPNEAERKTGKDKQRCNIG